METLFFPEAVFGKLDEVYAPAEDTFLLMDAIEQDLPYLKKEVVIAMECGSGSGAIITSLSKALGQSGRLMIATDINPTACLITKKCAEHNNQDGVEVIQADLELPLNDKLRNQVDLLIFNPPYVPTIESELSATGHSQINLSWAGGKFGRAIIDRFVWHTMPKLLSKPNGVAYMIALNKNDPHFLCHCLNERFDIQGTVVQQRRAGAESLYVIKYTWLVVD